MPSEEKRIFGLDFARAMAILLVVFHHIFLFSTPPDWLFPLGSLGSLGVEVLFGLFGFFLGQSLLRAVASQRFSTGSDLRRFYLNRWFRILPAYYGFFLVSALLFPPYYPQIATHLQYFFFLQNFAWKMPPLFFQSWTLSIIEFFYVFFILSLFSVYKFLRCIKLSLFITLACFALVPLLLRFRCTTLLNPDDFEAVIRKFVIYRLDTPVAGVLMALIQREYPGIWSLLRTHAWIGLGMFTGAAAYYWEGLPLLYTSHLVQVLFYPVIALTFALILPFLSEWKEERSIFGRGIYLISKLSYAIYLSHYATIMYVGIFAFMILGHGPMPSYAVLTPVFYASVLIVAYILHLTVELPFMNLRERWLQKKPEPAEISAAAHSPPPRAGKTPRKLKAVLPAPQ